MARRKNSEFLTSALRHEIRHLIAQKYQSLDHFQRMTGIPKSTISRLITGERNDCMLSTLGLIAKALKKKLVVKFD